MDMLTMLNDYKESKDCTYKNEHYSVRDNGAVMRHPREDKRARRIDNVWTFGKPNEQTGYMEIGSERVHRIVAFAFLGEPPTSQYVVDHIDTNRRNNRPQNLRWLTKLENALNNPITRKKIELLCGSIETFINDSSIIQEFADDNPNFGWMRTVTPDEAKASYERLLAWSKSDIKPATFRKGEMGEWIYKPTKQWPEWSTKSSDNYNVGGYTEKPIDYSFIDESPVNATTESLTPNAKQRHWKTPTEFPLCPDSIGDNPLEAYYKNLKKGAVITRNRNSTHYVEDFALCNDKLLMVSAYDPEGLKKYSILSITFEEGAYVHEGRTFFDPLGPQKELTLAQGLEWTGEDPFDDLC